MGDKKRMHDFDTASLIASTVSGFGFSTIHPYREAEEIPEPAGVEMSEGVIKSFEAGGWQRYNGS